MRACVQVYGVGGLIDEKEPLTLSFIKVQYLTLHNYICTLFLIFKPQFLFYKLKANVMLKLSLKQPVKQGFRKQKPSDGTFCALCSAGHPGDYQTLYKQKNQFRRSKTMPIYGVET